MMKTLAFTAMLGMALPFAAYAEPTPVEYDLTVAISTPKPNADGQVSAMKNLESFFFVCEEKGLVAASGTEANVTIKENDGDYEASAHLRKANGLNANHTYFSAAFEREPHYNGLYTITIERAAFGTEEWSRDPETGRTNDEIVLEFELVDGLSHADFNLKPEKVTPAAGTYAKGEEISLITFQFPEGTEMAKGATASLAGIDNTYVETERIRASGDAFTVEFPKPSEQGKYLLTVSAGAFGDASFIATGEGEASEPISIVYAIDSVTGTASISVAGEHDAYDLQGRRVDLSKAPAGVLIIDGRKVIVKN